MKLTPSEEADLKHLEQEKDRAVRDLDDAEYQAEVARSVVRGCEENLEEIVEKIEALLAKQDEE